MSYDRVIHQIPPLYGTVNKPRDATQHREALLRGTATRVMSALDSAKEKHHWLVVKNQASERANGTPDTHMQMRLM